MALDDRIRQLRKESGWSHAETGDKIGTDSRVSRHETGKIIPSVDAIVRIAQAHNIFVDHLLIDDIPRRLLHGAVHDLGDRLAGPSGLSGDDLASPPHMLDDLVAKNRLTTLAGGIS